MAIRRAILAGIILLFSVFGIYSGLNEKNFFSFFPFLSVVIASLVLYQSFDQWVPQTGLLIPGFFLGRLLFVGLVLYLNYRVLNMIKSDRIQKDGISTYGIATGISSTYIRGNRAFYRHFTYTANGRLLESKVRFSYDLNRGDTLYLKYSKSNPYIIDFENNAQNHRHRIVK